MRSFFWEMCVRVGSVYTPIKGIQLENGEGRGGGGGRSLLSF